MCAPIKPGAYLRLRREAAGLSIAEVATLIAPDGEPWAVTFNIDRIASIEAGRQAPSATVIDALAAAFRFDRHLHGLLAGFDQVMRICVACGCSDLDRCDDEAAGSCAWSPDHPDTCTHCVHREALIAPALPFAA